MCGRDFLLLIETFVGGGELQKLADEDHSSINLEVMEFIDFEGSFSDSVTQRSR